MTDLSRGARVRRGGRRPGWTLLTALLVLAIGASSALVFTDRAELLKLAVILALWAAVVAAFVSVIYRRQSDLDQARARDLKLVYDLQLDREIAARREYELTVESQLRRELALELRAQTSDEVSELRAELAALRTNLEILFDAELSERPALEGERRAVRGYSEWERDNESARERINRVQSVRAEEPARRADDSIIDVHEEPLVAAPPRQRATDSYQPNYAPQPHEAYAPPRQGRGAAEAAEPDRGSHRRSNDQETPATRNEPAPDVDWTPPHGQPSGWPTPNEWAGPERVEPPAPRRSHRRPESPSSEPQFAPPPPPEPARPQPRIPWPPPTEAPRAPSWHPAGSEGQLLPASGGNWDPSQPENPAPTSWAYDGGPSRDQPSHRSSTIGDPAAEPPVEWRGRHSSAAADQSDQDGDWSESGRRARSRHSVDHSESGSAGSAPALSPPPPPRQPAPPAPDRGPVMSSPPPASARHRSTEPLSAAEEPQSGGQSVADLLARLQSSPSEGGGRRRRRED
jgi:hypothetical protein